MLQITKSGDAEKYEICRQLYHSHFLENSKSRAAEKQIEERRASEISSKIEKTSKDYNLSFDLSQTHRNEISLSDIKGILAEGDKISAHIPNLTENERNFGVCLLPVPEKTAPLLFIARNEEEKFMIAVALQVLMVACQS
eukprot:GDKK01041839.1.p1 GENE.GDKK01041839.1~~GDKK01041839.1.p1  ORF type:complete len:140 (-),score=21.77 GDKK01041839.1:137-556(-)